MMNTVELRKISDQYLEALAAGTVTKVINLELYVKAIAEQQAKRSHEAWCTQKRAAGYTYGPTVDDELKTTNLLVPFEELPAAYKKANLDNAVAALKLMMAQGVMVGYPVTNEAKEQMINNMAEALHDEWVRSKMALGYKYAPTRNDDANKGELTHRDMLPFSTLMEVYPEDVAYDKQTAEGMINGMMENGMMLIRVA